MLSTALTIGSLVGAALGLFHAAGVYSRKLVAIPGRRARHPVRVRLEAAYAALWTLALWTAFGSYVLVLWLVSVPLWAGSRAAKAV